MLQRTPSLALRRWTRAPCVQSTSSGSVALTTHRFSTVASSAAAGPTHARLCRSEPHSKRAAHALDLTRSACARFSTSTRVSAGAPPQPFLLADIGEGIQEVEIIKFMAKEGDHVEEFDPICEVQSDKATVEITSRFAGTITQLTHKVGDIVKVGSPLCFIQKQGGEGSEEGQARPAPEQKEPQEPAALQPAPSKGQDTSTSTATQSRTETSSSASSTPSQFSRPGEDILATPAVRRLSRDHNVELANVNGTGKEGRITKEDVLRFIEENGSSGSGSGAPAAIPAQERRISEQTSISAASSGSGTNSSAPLDPIRRAMFKAMSNSLQIPHFAYSEEIDVTALDELRKSLSKSLAASSAKASASSASSPIQPPPKLTLLPLLVKALSLALNDHPLFLSTLELPRNTTSTAELASGAKLNRRASHDISIALSSPQGLLTPLLRAVEGRGILDLAAQIADFQTRANASGSGAKGGLTPADFGPGGSITLSNIGAVGGGTYTHPIIPPTGQLAIGALGRTRALPRFASECPADGLGEVGTGPGASSDPNRVLRRLIMPVSFTGDHRVVEGAEMARLVQRWKTLVEQPALWFTLLK